MPPIPTVTISLRVPVELYQELIMDESENGHSGSFNAYLVGLLRKAVAK